MFFIKEIADIKVFQSDIFEKSDNFIHGFSTRSCGSMKQFENENHIKNRKSLCKKLKLDFEKLILPEQKHTDNIKIISDKDESIDNTDAIITNKKNIPIMLLFADCVPVILYSSSKNVLAVVHAGWRGTAKNIVSKTVKKMQDEFEVEVSDVKAAIGPAIGDCCYEVLEETFEQLKKTLKSENFAKCFKQIKDNKFYVDLKKINSHQLMEVGLRDIDIMGYCTSCNDFLFYSYRKAKGHTGRHCAIACLK